MNTSLEELKKQFCEDCWAHMTRTSSHILRGINAHDLAVVLSSLVYRLSVIMRKKDLNEVGTDEDQKLAYAEEQLLGDALIKFTIHPGNQKLTSRCISGHMGNGIEIAGLRCPHRERVKT